MTCISRPRPEDHLAKIERSDGAMIRSLNLPGCANTFTPQRAPYTATHLAYPNLITHSLFFEAVKHLALVPQKRSGESGEQS